MSFFSASSRRASAPMCSHRAPPITPPLPSLSLAPRRSRTPVPFSRAPSLSELDLPPAQHVRFHFLLCFPSHHPFFPSRPFFCCFSISVCALLAFFSFSSPSTLTLRPLPLPRFFLCCSVRAPLSSPPPLVVLALGSTFVVVPGATRLAGVCGREMGTLADLATRGGGQVGGRGRGLTPHTLRCLHTHNLTNRNTFLLPTLVLLLFSPASQAV